MGKEGDGGVPTDDGLGRPYGLVVAAVAGVALWVLVSFFWECLEQLTRGPG
jgi:hypothetical protein